MKGRGWLSWGDEGMGLGGVEGESGKMTVGLGEEGGGMVR